jgi:hypothetical protein
MSSEGAPSQQRFSITFPGESGHRANAAAASLGDAIRDVDASLLVHREKTNPNTQDAGSILTIVLGSAPVAAVAAGIAAWIRMQRLVIRIAAKGPRINKLPLTGLTPTSRAT